MGGAAGGVWVTGRHDGRSMGDALTGASLLHGHLRPIGGDYDRLRTRGNIGS